MGNTIVFIEHRAVTNERKARISFASFVCPFDDVEIEPLDPHVDGLTHHKIYKKVQVWRVSQAINGEKNGGKSTHPSCKI